MPPNALAAISLEDYTFHSLDKLRYGDTDRQGHVNNAVFGTLLETGRIELLSDPSLPQTDRAFVIARLVIDFIGEITWPGAIDIGTRVATIGKSSLTMEQALFQGDRCVARADSVIVQIDTGTRRSHPLCPVAQDYFSKFIRCP